MLSIKQNAAVYHPNGEKRSYVKYDPSKSPLDFRFESGFPVKSSVNDEPGTGSLGTYTKSSSPYGLSNTPNPQQIQGVRADRYALQTSIRKLIMRRNGFASDEIVSLEDYNDLHRVVKCARTRIGMFVDIKLDAEINKACYSGLSICGSVWACPCCAAKIQEVRRKDVSKAMEWAYSNSLKAVMVTFTTPHYEHQTCSSLLDKMSAAFKYFRSGKSFQNFKERVGFEGLIRGLETMYGRNGWHNHTHELWFVDSDTDAKELKAYVVDRWEKACQKQGLIPKGNLRKFREHSIDVWDNASTSDYLSKQDDSKYLKWGADSEITSQGIKRSNRGTHPFQLVALWNMGYEDAGDKFIEYIEAFKGRSQLYWSQGLKKKVFKDEDELTDQEASELEKPELELIATLEHFAWQTVLDKKARSELLDIAENEGEDGIDAWLKRYGLHQAARY